MPKTLSFLVLAGSTLVVGTQALPQDPPSKPSMATMAEHALLLVEAEKGNPDAAYLVAECYLEGKKVTKDQSLAHKWFLLASEAGIARASNKLAWMYVQGTGVAVDPAKGAAWFKLAAEQGDREALYQLGWMYEHGSGVAQDFHTAADWYRRGAAAGDEDSMACLGWLLENGRGVEKSASSAAYLYERASKEGSAMAMTNLAWLLIEGKGVEKNIGKAVELIKDAARRQHPRGEGSLGYLYENGIGLEKNPDLALEWWDKSAQHGDIKSIRYLARAFSFGINRRSDDQKALAYALQGAKLQQDPGCYLLLGQLLAMRSPNAIAYPAEVRSAAEIGVRSSLPEALPALVWCHLHGVGSESSITQADLLFEKAVVNPSCHPALFRLGLSLEMGAAGKTDKVHAKAWEAALAKHGFKAARVAQARRQLQGEPLEKSLGFESLLALSKEGDASAALELGRAWEQGLGTKKSVQEALRWYRVSLDGGFPGAILELAQAFHSGRLGIKDEAEAARLYRRAQAMGFPLSPAIFKPDGSLENFNKVKVPGAPQNRGATTKTFAVTMVTSDTKTAVPEPAPPGNIPEPPRKQ